MTIDEKHALAGSVEHLYSLMLRIKGISAQGRIDDCCMDGLNRLDKLKEHFDITELVREIHSRRIDPMM